MAGPVRRNFGLDVLRCLAILMVLANHALLFWFLAGPPDWHATPGVAYDGKVAATSLLSILSIEWLFVLSGFLIGTMMIRTFEGAPTFWAGARGFWLRRWFRTLPNYYAFLGVNVLLVSWGWAEGQPSWRHALFLQNLAWPELSDAQLAAGDTFFFTEAWSLALDEWFYLAAPLLVGLFALARLPPQAAFLLTTASLMLGPMLLRLLQAPPDVAAAPLSLFDWDLRVRRVTVAHLDATGWGVLAAVLGRWHPAFWQRRLAAKAVAGLALMAAGIAVVEALFFGHAATPVAPVAAAVAAAPRLANVLGITLMAAGTFLALPAITRLPTVPWSRRAVEAMSNYSYSIYLAHLPVLFVLVRFWGGGATLGAAGVRTGVWLAVTLLVAAAVHHSFEKPLSDLRERFTRRIDASPFGPAPPP